ncbi:MAG: tryptophan synthase subunit alpha [Candidatus Bathyarchaeia archaeon]
MLAEASCFIYLIGLEGVTGLRIRGLKATLKLVRKVKETTDKPILVVFGVSKREHAKAQFPAGPTALWLEAHTQEYTRKTWKTHSKNCQK